MNFSSKTKKFGQSPVAAACVSLVIGMASTSAVAETATINFPSATFPSETLAQINLGTGFYGLNADFAVVNGMPGVTIPVQSVQTLYNTATQTLTANVDLTAGAGGILNEQNGGGTVTSNVSSNSISASGTGNQVTLASGGSVATIDLGLMATNKSIGALAVQYLGGWNSGAGQVNVQANVSGSTVGALFNGMYAAPIAVNSNVVKASATLNDATTVLAGAVPLGFAHNTGGSSSINFNPTSAIGGGDVQGSWNATLGINTLQSTVNGGISSGSTGGSYAALTDDTIAIKTQRTYDFATYDVDGWYTGQSYTDLSSPLTLNNNTQSAAFTGNKAVSVVQVDATSNAFSGSASVTNAQANVETLDYVSGAPTAQVSNSQIVADLTYAGVQGLGVSPTALTSSLSVSGTALAPQSISAQSIGNAAGSLNSAGQLTSSGNAIEFSSKNVDLTGSSNADTGAYIGSPSQTVGGDLLVNSAQINQRPNTSGSGVDSLVQGSGITAAVDRLAATGSISVNYDAVTSGATGNLAGNLINAQGSNITASMAVVGTQQNTNADVAAQNLGSLIGAGIGDAAVGTNYTVAERAATTAVSGSVTANNNAIGAVAQGNLAANTLLAAAGNTLTAQYNNYWGEDSVHNTVSAGGASVNAGLVAVNVQGNTDSTAYANVSGGSVFIAGVDQAGNNVGNLVPLGAATLTASSNRISALAQGNNGGTNIGASAGGAMALTAAAANSQSNDGASPVIASLSDSNVLVTGLSSVGTTIATNSNTLAADASGNLGVNAISISGGSTVNGSVGVNTSNLQNLQGNEAAITAGASGSAVGVLLGAASTNVAPHGYGFSTTSVATWVDPYTSSAYSGTDSDFTSMLGRDVTTVMGATLAIDSSKVAAGATANQVSNSASLSGTAVGGIAPVASVIGNVQDNSGVVQSSVASTDVGVRLVDQSITVTSIPSYNNYAATSNSFDSDPTSGVTWVNVNLDTARAVASNSLTNSSAGSITAINTSTVSVSGSTLAAASNGNVASNVLGLSGTDVTLAAGLPLAVGNDQGNTAGAAILASVSDANVGVLVGDSLAGVTGTGSSTLLGTVTATVQPTTTYVGPSGIFSGSATAWIDTPVVGAMSATGIKALTATVDNSVLSATSTANSADNRITVGATALAAASNAIAGVSNYQGNDANFSGGLSAVNLGVVLADVTSGQTSTASGSTTATVVATSNGGSAIVGGAAASTALSASGSATAMGVSGSSVSVQRSALTATAKGNTVTNVIDLGSTASAQLGAQIMNASNGNDGQSNTGNGSATMSGVALGSITGAVGATSTSTSTAVATGSGYATDNANASVSNASAIASGSATAVATATGLSANTNTVSGNSLSAAVLGNEAINVVSGSGTMMAALANQAAAYLYNDQNNTGGLTAAVGTPLAGIQLGTIVGAVSSTGIATASSTATGSATALATDGSTNGETTSADFASSATANAWSTVTATGITGLVAGVDGNTLQATNTGNSAINAIRLAATTIGGSSDVSTLFNGNYQGNDGAVSAGSLSASVDNVALGVMLASVDATVHVSGSASATAASTATNTNTPVWASGSTFYVSNTADATSSGGATTTVSGSATALGIVATQASVASNVLRAANTGNSASTITSLSASNLSGVVGSTTVFADNSQFNRMSLSAALGADNGVTVGVSGGAVTAYVTASGGASAASTTDSTANNYSQYWNGVTNVSTSTDSGTVTTTSSANATANASATATGMTGSTFNVLSNQLEASNVGNSAYTAAVLDGTLLGTATAPLSVDTNSGQYNRANGTATAGNIMLGVSQAAVSATASGSASYSSSPSLDIYGVQGNGSNSATTTASAYGIVGSAISVGGTQAAPQTITAQSVGNSATTLIAATQTALSGAGGSATLTVAGTQENSGVQSATVGGNASPVTVGVKVGNVTATADSSVAVARTTSGAPYYNWTYDTSVTASAVGISGGSAAVQYNTLAAKTYGNSAVNGVSASTATTLAGSNAGVNTLRASNWQTNTASATSTVAAADIGVVVGNVSASTYGYNWNADTAVAINNAQLNVSNNQSLATSIGNVADNSVLASAAVAGSSLLPVSSLSENYQTNLRGQTALVDAMRVGTFTGSVYGEDSSYGITNSSLTVGGNQLQAATYGNSANNVNQLNASVTANVDAISTINNQTNGVLAEGQSTVSNTIVGVGVDVAWSGALVNTPTTVQSNTLSALSYGNNANNTTSVSGGTTLTAGTAAVAYQTANDQANSASMTSTANAIEVGVMTGTGFGAGSSGYGVDASPVVVKDNAVTATNYGNRANNSLSLSAGNVIDGNGHLAKVRNTQTNYGTGSATAILSAVNVGVITDAGWDNVRNSSVTVTGNQLTAASYLNTASNSLSLAAQVLDAPATLTNQQINDASGLGKISGVNVGLQQDGGAGNSQSLYNVTSDVSNNALNAQAGGNTASNVLNATASATIANAGGPSFQVLNSQSNNGVMTALLETAYVGNWGNTNSNYYGPTTMTVSMNTAVASAYGNTASNDLSMSALTGATNSASTALSNRQSNTASLSATVNGVRMGVGSGQGTGTVSVSGNSIAASTVGNAASNRVGIAR